MSDDNSVPEPSEEETKENPDENVNENASGEVTPCHSDLGQCCRLESPETCQTLDVIDQDLKEHNEQLKELYLSVTIFWEV